MKRALVVSIVALSFACKTEPREPPVAPPEAPAEPAEPQKADPTCVGPLTKGAPQAIRIGDVEWELAGSTLISKTPADELVIGAIADVKEDTEENLGNLRQLVAWFASKKVDLIILAGDTGENQKQLEAALETVAVARVPVLNVIGNREGKTDYRNALVAARAKHANVFDLNIVRRVDTPVADIISMPGYYNPSYIHNDDGCLYFDGDLRELETLAARCDSPVVLVSHGGPRQQGPLAIDRTAEGANVGDAGLATAIRRAKIPFGIFGNIHEAGGRATDLSGKTLLEPGKEHGSLYLNPGPADGVRWGMNDGSESIGMGATLTIKGGKGSYEIFRVPKKATGARPKKQPPK